MEKKKCSVCGKPLEDNNSKDDMCQVCYAVKEVRTQRNLLSNKSRKEKNDVVQFKLEKGERGGMQNKFINKDGFKSLTDFICFGIALAGVYSDNMLDENVTAAIDQAISRLAENAGEAEASGIPPSALEVAYRVVNNTYQLQGYMSPSNVVFVKEKVHTSTESAFGEISEKITDWEKSQNKENSFFSVRLAKDGVPYSKTDDGNTGDTLYNKMIEYFSHQIYSLERKGVSLRFNPVYQNDYWILNTEMVLLKDHYYRMIKDATNKAIGAIAIKLKEWSERKYGYSNEFVAKELIPYRDLSMVRLSREEITNVILCQIRAFMSKQEPYTLKGYTYKLEDATEGYQVVIVAVR